MAFQYSFSVCTTDPTNANYFVAQWYGNPGPVGVTAVTPTTYRSSTPYRLAFRIVDAKGLVVNTVAHRTQQSGSLFFQVRGYDYRAYTFPLSYSIKYGTTELISGRITDECGGAAPIEGNQSEQLTSQPSIPTTPCAPVPPSFSSPPVPTQCGGSYVASGPAGFGTP
jgi:hypothetical protein